MSLKLVSLFVTAVTKLLNVTEASNRGLARGPLVLDCGWIKGLEALDRLSLQLLSLVFVFSQ